MKDAKKLKKMKKIAILQSNYIPWKGYFDMINMVDEFVLYDTVQYTKNDWRNRNLIKTQKGLEWITIPVQHTLSQKINETKIFDKKWNKKHFHTLITNYSKSAYFKDYKDTFEHYYFQNTEEFLSRINYGFITKINEILNIKTLISRSEDFKIYGEKTEKLIAICKQAGATEYISGPAAKSYLDEKLFQQENIKVTWMDYTGYREYNQLFPPFEHGVSILDLIFNEGKNATKFMKSF